MATREQILAAGGTIPERTNVTDAGYTYGGKNFVYETRKDAMGNDYKVDVEQPITSTAGGTSAMTNTGLAGSVYSSSAPIVAEENNAASTVAKINVSDAELASQNYRAEIQKQYDALEARRASTEASINSSFDSAKTKLGGEQTKEKGTFTSTLARIGGYLGESASAQGALINLNQQHQFEISDLEAKRNSALQEARDAVDEKQAALALKKAQEYKDLSKEIQDRKEKFFTQSMAIVKEEREKQSEDRLRKSAEITDATKIADQTASTLDTFFKSNPNMTQEQQDQAIIQVAQAKGIDPSFVAQSLADYRRTVASTQPEIVREYEYAVAQGQFNGTLIEYTKLKRDAMRVATTGGNTFTEQEAARYDLPVELVGKTEVEIIDDLNVEKVPEWFKKSQVRAGHITDKAPESEFKTQWNTFRNLPDVKVFRDTVDRNKVISTSGNVLPGAGFNWSSYEPDTAETTPAE